MKKRILIVLAIFVLLSLTVLAACTDPCVHEYEDKWNSEKHWKECKLCHEKKDESTHNLEWNTTDANDHWQECSVCGYATDSAAHTEGANGKCSVCGKDLHAHVYSWTSDAVNHWQVCACGDTTTPAAHVDVKNNETQAEGADGKCDVCGHEIYTVSFDMQGHGQAVAAQNIGKGGKATAPAAPARDGEYEFKGWYKEAACENEFDFAAEVINGATTVYAKWEEDTTAGASKKYAHQLTLGEDSLQAIATDQVVYFVYTAQENGRYTISLGAGLISAKCTFTTDKTGETVYNADNDSVNIDLAAKEKVYIMLTCSEELADDAMASVMIAECVGGDTLPADIFPAGEYTDGGYYMFELDRDNMQAVIDEDTYDVAYIGGQYSNKLVIKRDMGLIGTVIWTITPNEDGSYRLLVDDGWMPTTSTLHIVEPQAPVALSAIVGYYEPTEDSETDYSTVTELYIYAGTSETQTSVLVLQYGTYSRYSAQYNAEKNRLTFNYTTLTLNLNEDNEVVSLSLGGVAYELKGELGIAPPTKLDLEDDSEYNGEENVLTATVYGQNLNTNSITVMGYVEATGVYTVVVNEQGEFVVYQITISQDGKTITLCDKDGEELDTLTKFEWVSRDLPTNGTLEVTADGFQNNLYLFTVKQTGWYSFTGIANGAEVYYSLNELDYTDTYGARKAVNGQAAYLVADSHLAVYMEEPADLSGLTIAPAEKPATQSAPQAIEEGTTSLDVMDNSTYYLTFTATHAGTYFVQAYFNASEYNAFFLYTINGEQYGYDDETGDWLGGMSYGNSVVRIVLTDDNLTINIQIPCQGEVEEGEDAWKYINITVTEDYSATATDVTWSDTRTDESLTLTATVDSNANYHIESIKGQQVVITGSAAFTVKLQNGKVIVSEDNTAIIRLIDVDDDELYFRLESATEQELTLTQSFEKGSEGYPLEAIWEDGVGTVELPAAEEGNWFGITVYFTVAAGTYKISAPEDTYVDLDLNGNSIRLGQVITVEDGDVLSCNHDYNEVIILTISTATYVFDEDQIGTYKGTVSGEDFMGPYEYDITLTFDRFGAGTYALDQGYGADPSSISISKNEDGTYSFIYNDMFTVTFSFGANGLEVVDEDLGEFTLEKQVALAPIIYTGYDDTTGRDITFAVAPDFMSAQYTVVMDNDLAVDQKVNISKDGETYSFTYLDSGELTTVEFTVDGDTLVLIDDYYNLMMGTESTSLTKQA